ncbi:hypothetical protein [Hamadaea tsunoensis]|uniref:hypothetical protein n=1 Tax=Hamadaea tsunoensis TaxID=53368 RepID=UPI000423FF0B|nr:hypothetical protein [Hamadaea tsunoensis]
MGTTHLISGTLPTLAGLVVDGTIPDPVTRTRTPTGAVAAYADLAAGRHSPGRTVIMINES